MITTTGHAFNPTESPPPNGSRWLADDVVNNSVYAIHLINDSVGDALHQVVRQTRPIRGHAIFTAYATQDYWVCVGGLVAHHANAAQRQQHSKRLPNVVTKDGSTDN